MKLCANLLLFACTASAVNVSPVQKVVELLDQLKGKVKADLDAEAAVQTEFAEFCDKELSDKGYAIKTAVREIAGHNAAIDDATATIGAKEAEIADLGTRISGKETEVAEAANVYAGQKADFDASEKELTDTIDELASGVVQIKRGASLMQVKKNLKPVAEVLSKIAEAAGLVGLKQHKLQALLQSGENDDLSLHAPQGSVDVGGGGHSGGILTTLEDMKAKAEDQLSAARKAAMKNNHDHEMLQMSGAQEIKNLKDTMAQSAAMKASTAEVLGKSRGELAEVEKSKAADEEYVQATKLECETKASEWAARQADADNEVAAIAKAKGILQNGVKAFVQVSSTRRVVDEDDRAASRRTRLVKALKAMSGKFGSYAMMQLAHMAAADPFAKIKGLISDMIEKLLNEANEEASHKAFCDEELAKSKSSQATKSQKLDKYLARIDTAQATIAELNEAIKALEGELAEIDAAQAEATQIRTQENTDYLKASGDFKASAEAVAGAIQVLRSYYEGGSFIQISATTNSKSKVKDANTIISVLEMAEGDFTTLLAEADTEETSAASSYEKTSQDNKVTKAAKQMEIKGKQSEIKSLTVQLGNYQEDKTAVGEELDAVMAYSDKLKPECEVKVMSYEEKVARREAEIEGLKEALSILEGQDIPVLMQTGMLRGVRQHA